MASFHDSKPVFGIAKLHREVGQLSQYACQTPKSPLNPPFFFLIA